MLMINGIILSGLQYHTCKHMLGLYLRQGIYAYTTALECKYYYCCIAGIDGRHFAWQLCENADRLKSNSSYNYAKFFDKILNS